MDFCSIFRGTDKIYHLDPPRLNTSFPRHPLWGYEGKLYDLSEIERGGICQPTNKYRRGFSHQLTFDFLLTTVVLGAALYPLWLRGYFADDDDLVDSVFGSFRTALVVSKAVSETIGEECNEMSNKGIVTAMRMRGGVSLAKGRNERQEDVGGKYESLALDDIEYEGSRVTVKQWREEMIESRAKAIRIAMSNVRVA